MTRTFQQTGYWNRRATLTIYMSRLPWLQRRKLRLESCGTCSNDLDDRKRRDASILFSLSNHCYRFIHTCSDRNIRQTASAERTIIGTPLSMGGSSWTPTVHVTTFIPSSGQKHPKKPNPWAEHPPAPAENVNPVTPCPDRHQTLTVVIIYWQRVQPTRRMNHDRETNRSVHQEAPDRRSPLIFHLQSSHILSALSSVPNPHPYKQQSLGLDERKVTQFQTANAISQTPKKEIERPKRRAELQKEIAGTQRFSFRSNVRGQERQDSLQINVHR